MLFGLFFDGCGRCLFVWNSILFLNVDIRVFVVVVVVAVVIFVCFFFFLNKIQSCSRQDVCACRISIHSWLYAAKVTSTH